MLILVRRRLNLLNKGGFSMKKKRKKDRMTSTFVSDELEGVVLIICIGSAFLAVWGLWLAVEALTQGGSLTELVQGLGTFIFFAITARMTAKRL